ncbi:MAG: hypothetical protein RJB26_2078 [Pseudomonadota bacterium]|jgi:hypothetical protein
MNESASRADDSVFKALALEQAEKKLQGVLLVFIPTVYILKPGLT